MSEEKKLTVRYFSEKYGIPLLTEEDMKKRPRGFVIAGPMSVTPRKKPKKTDSTRQD